MPMRTSVSSAAFIRNIGYWQAEALRAPVVITHHGRERLILTTTADFEAGADTRLAAYLAIFDHMSEAALIFDEEGKLLCANLAAQQAALLRSKASQVTSISDLWPELPAKVFDAALFRARASKSAQVFECTSAANGSLHVNVIPIEGATVVLLSQATNAVSEEMVARLQIQ